MEIEVTTFAELEDFYRSFEAGHHQLLVVNGPPGLEKTTMARRICGSAKYIVCNVSPFQLFRLGYLHRNENFILDDVDHLHKDAVATRVLKAFTDSQKVRLIAWHTASPFLSTKTEDGETESIPMEYETTSRTIIISNDFKSLNANIRALADRGLVIHFHPTNLEIHKRVAHWFTDDEIYQYIGAHLGVIKGHSMRIYGEALNLKRSGNDWRDCLLRHWKIDPAMVAVERLLADGHLTMSQREDQFITAGHGSRATFYRIAKKVRGAGDLGETLRLGTTDEVSKSHDSGNVSPEPPPSPVTTPPPADTTKSDAIPTTVAQTPSDDPSVTTPINGKMLMPLATNAIATVAPLPPVAAMSTAAMRDRISTLDKIISSATGDERVNAIAEENKLRSILCPIQSEKAETILSWTMKNSITTRVEIKVFRWSDGFWSAQYHVDIRTAGTGGPFRVMFATKGDAINYAIGEVSGWVEREGAGRITKTAQRQLNAMRRAINEFITSNGGNENVGGPTGDASPTTQAVKEPVVEAVSADTIEQTK